jgi:hypothetical protein
LLAVFDWRRLDGVLEDLVDPLDDLAFLRGPPVEIRNEETPLFVKMDEFILLRVCHDPENARVLFIHFFAAVLQAIARKNFSQDIFFAWHFISLTENLNRKQNVITKADLGWVTENESTLFRAHLDKVLAVVDTSQDLMNLVSDHPEDTKKFRIISDFAQEIKSVTMPPPATVAATEFTTAEDAAYAVQVTYTRNDLEHLWTLRDTDEVSDGQLSHHIGQC